MASYIVAASLFDFLPELEDNEIDAVVTDPPYELGFMGKKWDASGVAFDPATWAAVLRVLKPGGHLLASGGTRTYHRMVCAIEDAGFEIRDQLAWLYGSGFPKGEDAGRNIDMLRCTLPGVHCDKTLSKKPGAHICPAHPDGDPHRGKRTGLKPAQEPIVLARKPLVGTVAANVLAHGTGAINVDGCRVGTENTRRAHNGIRSGVGLNCAEDGSMAGAPGVTGSDTGRWPANVIMDEAAGAMLDEQSGTTTSSDRVRKNGAFQSVAKGAETERESFGFSDTGGASRFFYCAKTSRAEREAGLEHLPKRSAGELTDRTDETAALNCPRTGAGRTAAGRANHHPTVKPIALMRWLVRLITPPGGVVLDPFTGSGSTHIAAKLEGFDSVGCDLSPEYVEIAKARVDAA